MEQWNVNLQHLVGQTRSLEVAYVGSRGHALISARDMNQPAASPIVPNLRPNPAFADITLIESRASSLYNALQVRYQERPSNGALMLLSSAWMRAFSPLTPAWVIAAQPVLPVVVV